MTRTHTNLGTLRARLPDEVTRCWNEHCGKRETCRRYLGRNTGGVHVLHAMFHAECGEKYIHAD